MTDTHSDWRERTLALEDLEGPDREAALAHLETCPECRSLREAILAREAQARPAGSLPPPSRWDALALDDLSRAGERRSLAALLEREAHRGRERPARRPAFHWWVPAAAAAAVIMAVMTTRTPPPSPIETPGPITSPATPPLSLPAEVHGLLIAPGPGLRGGVGSKWHTGDAFTIDFTLESRSPVIVVHLDPRGAASLLVPDSAGARAPVLGPGLVTLPPEGAGVRWTFEGEPGTETFLIATFAGPPDVAAVAAALSTIAPGDRAEALRAAYRALASAGARIEQAEAAVGR